MCRSSAHWRGICYCSLCMSLKGGLIRRLHSLLLVFVQDVFARIYPGCFAVAWVHILMTTSAGRSQFFQSSFWLTWSSKCMAMINATFFAGLITCNHWNCLASWSKARVDQKALRVSIHQCKNRYENQQAFLRIVMVAGQDGSRQCWTEWNSLATGSHWFATALCRPDRECTHRSESMTPGTETAWDECPAVEG